MTFRDALLERASAANLTIADAHILKLQEYFELLARWNRTINLTSMALDGYPNATIDRLLIEPLIASNAMLDTVSDWADLGSGGGSPAIPMKIVRPAPRLSLVESKERKAAFLREAVRSLRLHDVSIHVRRFETLETALIPSLDLVTVRAVRIDRGLIDTATSVLRPGGKLFLFARAEHVLEHFRLTLTVPMPGGESFLCVYELSG